MADKGNLETHLGLATALADPDPQAESSAMVRVLQMFITQGKVARAPVLVFNCVEQFNHAVKAAAKAAAFKCVNQVSGAAIAAALLQAVADPT